MTHRLAISIPTYGRADTVAANLAAMVEDARGRDVAFYVSDDTPDTSVEDALADLRAAGHPIQYRRNGLGPGHDRNVMAALLWPMADFTWLLGSALRVKAGQLARVLAFLDGQDLVLVNSHSDDERLVPSVRGEEARALLREALWHQTMTGATIYGRRVCEWARAGGDSLTLIPNFPQLSVMMGYASVHTATIGWFGERSVEATIFNQSYWRANGAIDVFVRDWGAAVAAFPAIVPPDQRVRVTRMHSVRQNLFKADYLVELRRSGQVGWASLRQPFFLDAMHLSRWKLAAILGLPQGLLEMAIAARERVSRGLAARRSR